MALILTVPQTNLPAGTQTFTSGAIDPTLQGFTITIIQGAWPFAGDKAFDAKLDCSLDGGTTWLGVSGLDVTDAPFPLNKQGGTTNTATWNASPLPGIGTSGRLLRMTLTLAKPLSIGGSVNAN